MNRPIRCPACDHEIPVEGASSGDQIDPELVSNDLAGSGGSFHSDRSRRGKNSPLAHAVRWGSAALVLAAIVAVIYQAAATGSSTRRPNVVEVEGLGSSIEPIVRQPAADLPGFDRAAAIANSIVILETEDASGSTTLGTGFVVQTAANDSESLVVVTNYHVLSAATSAYARFQDGSRYPVEGYWAIGREMDLAALALESLPVNALPLALREEQPAVGEPVTAVGHPAKLAFSSYDGEVSQLTETKLLPRSAQQYLRGTIRGDWNLHWIQHTARLTEGNSGGPLFDQQGRVIGINTWTNREAGFGYALDVRHIGSLLERPLAEVAPLARHADRETLAEELRESLSAQQLKDMLANCKQFGFLPADVDQYRKLQELAVAMTYAGRQPIAAENSARKQEREKILSMVDQIARELRARDWDAIGGTTIINEFAASEIDRPMAGIMAFGTVGRVVSSDNGSRGMLISIVGTDREIFVVLDGLLINPEPGTQCLILGMNFQGQVVRYGDNPLQLSEVPVVVTASDGIVVLGN